MVVTGLAFYTVGLGSPGKIAVAMLDETERRM